MNARLFRWMLLAGLLMAISAPAQVAVPQQPPAQPGINPESMYGKESAQGVYVRDSAVALEKFANAQHMERLKEWAKAADLYQEVIEKFSDRVVPSQVDSDNNIYQYTSVIAAVQQKMSHWPADGLEVYRARYESAASTILDSAGPEDRTAMQSILSRYFATDTAKVAGIRLMDLYFEAGEFPASAWLGELLLAQHPNLIIERPRVMYRCALAYHMAGDEERAKSILATLTAKYPQETASIRGTDQRLVDALTADLAEAAPHQQEIADSAWPMYGGSVNHTRLSTAGGLPGAKIASIELSKPNFKGMNPDQVVPLRQRDSQDQSSGATLGVMPVVDQGEMFFQDGMKIYAVNIESGSALPEWLKTYPGDRKGQYQAPGVRIPPRAQLQTVTLTENKVLAVMGQSDRVATMYGVASQTEGKLVCLDRTTGKERWTASGKNLPDDAGTLRNAEFAGAPLVVDNNVYVVGRSAKGVEFEDCYVFCFDLETGKYKWNCYIASANAAGNAMMRMQFGIEGGDSDTMAQLAYSSGRLYVLTNLGALAAVDAYGGRIVWLSIYPRDQGSAMDMNGGAAPTTNSDKPWMCSPVFIDNGKIFVLPTDGKFLEIYDAGSGVEVKRMDPKHLTPSPLPNQPADAANALIAVNGSRLLVSGPKSAMYIDWEKYDIKSFDKKRDPSIVWPRNFASNIRGRAFVANDRAFFPTVERIYVIALKGGKVQEVYPDFAKYPKGWDNKDGSEGPGNIVVSDDDVIVAANRRIDVYTNLDAARYKVEAEIAADPNSPALRLKYADRMFAAGEFPTAMQKLDEAIDLIGGRDKMAPGAARDSIYYAAIHQAEKFGKDIKDSNSENVALVEQLYDRAGAAALSPGQQVDYRVRRAKLASTLRDYPLAVKLYQQLNADADWRKVSVPDGENGSPVAASIFARHAIDDLIHTAGPICYAPFEQDATQQFTAAKASNQIDALLNVAAVYPNAKVAVSAMMAAADLKDAGGDHTGAVQLLRQVYLTYPNAPDRQRILESLARNYMGIPNRSSVAIARLGEAVKMGGNVNLSQPITLPDGRVLSNVTLAQALEELKKARGQEIAKSLPEFNLPIPNYIRSPEGKKKYREPFAPQTPDSIIPDVQALIVPTKDYQRTDRIATFTPGTGLNIFAVGSIKPIATLPLADPPGLAWSPNGPIAWVATQATQLRGDTSTVAWTFDLKSAPSVEAVASTGDDSAPDQNGDQQADVVNGNVRVIVQGNRRFIVQNGRVRNLGGQGVGPQDVVARGNTEAILEARPIGDAVMFTTSFGRIIVIGANDGRLRWQSRVGNDPPDRVVANEDFLAVLQHEEATISLTVFDTFSGQMIGRRTFDDGFHVPMNVALSPDGTLVFSEPDRIVMKNLYEPWTTADREIIDQKAAQTGQFPYINSGRGDQLQISDGRILAVADQGVTLRVFSMETGKPLRYKPADSNKEIDMVLQTGNRQPTAPVSLRVVGSQVYLVGNQTLISYNLDKPDQSWRLTQADTVKDKTADIFVGRKHLVVLTDSSKRVNAGKVSSFHLRAHARYGTSDADSAESGLTEYNYEVSDPSGITTWQAVDGGFYYLAADQKLHFLKGLGS